MNDKALPLLDVDNLTTAIRESGRLHAGRVVAASIEFSHSTLLSQFHRVKLDYSRAAEGPRYLYLKMDRPGRPAVEWESSRREAAFYSTVGRATPAGLMPHPYLAELGVDGTWRILMEDLGDTHSVATQWPLPPSLAQSEAMVRCLAKFHAAWWDHTLLGNGIGVWPTETEDDAWRAELVKQYAEFSDMLGEALSSKRRRLYERLFAEFPGSARIGSHHALTIIHGDAHFWNFFLPRCTIADTARLIDWDSWRIAFGAEDLAYMIAMWWFPEMRVHLEMRLLDSYHDELMIQGIRGYDRLALQDDYKLAVLRQTIRPIRMKAAGIAASVWWYNLERIHLAVDDLGCRELLS